MDRLWNLYVCLDDLENGERVRLNYKPFLGNFTQARNETYRLAFEIAGITSFWYEMVVVK